MKTNERSNTVRAVNLGMMTRIAMFAAIIAVFAQIFVPLPMTPVPITLQTLGVMLCAVILSPLEAVCAIGLYILMGIIGLPVFSRFMGGIGILAGPTGGFIVSWLPAVWIMSRVLHKNKFQNYYVLIAVIILFTLIVYGFGLVWFMISLDKSFYEAAAACAIPYLPGDALKGVAVVLSFRGLLRLRTRQG